MNFGQNVFDWLIGNLQPIVIIAVIVGVIICCAKREFTKLIAVVAVGVIAIGFTFNSSGTKNVLLNLYNQVIIGNAGGGSEESSDNGK